VVGISKVEPSISVAKVLAGESADLNPPTLGLRVEESKQEAWRELVYVVPRLGGHHATLVSSVQVTPITG
jgi:hypothetical protein